MFDQDYPTAADTRRGLREINHVAALAIRNVNRPGNAAKGCWRELSRRRLFWLLVVEVWELGDAMWSLYCLRRRYDRTPQWEDDAREWLRIELEAARHHVKHEIGDCVAFLAFLGDRV